MTVVHCPRCGSTDWRAEQEYRLDLFIWGYTCMKCGAWMTEDHFRKLGRIEKSSAAESFGPNMKVAELFDGEDSQ